MRAKTIRGMSHAALRDAARMMVLAVTVSVAAACAATPEPAPTPDPTPAPPAHTDPRVGLAAGWPDAAEAAAGMELIAHVDRPEGFYDPNAPGNLMLGNTDMAFRDELLFLGSFHGFNVYDISNPADPRLRTSFVCPGGQGDLSVHGDLLFMSVEMPNARVDCGTEPPQQRASPDRFRGVRVFDVSDVDRPRQVAAVQTCRGSHTHTLVTDPDDDSRVWIYVSGASTVRPAEELAGCSGLPPEEDPETALFRIEVIEVPLASPQDARIVNMPRLFADPETGEIAGLWQGGRAGPGTQATARTDQCHDITVFPEIGLGAGACSGNGILIDISNPAEPERVDEVFDPNFAYWHSATFDNEGDKVLFTDEWGGGSAARCQASDDPRWGANAIFEIRNRQMEHVGYYKLPAPQTAQENCVAHNGSLVPVPGRDIMAQAWYQGGISVLDFTDPESPVEIAYFDRGPYSASQLLLGGYWSSYWYNGHIYGSEIGRGLDVFELEPSELLSRNEIEAAKLVRQQQFNPQTQTRIEWPAELVVARALIDQLERDGFADAQALASYRARMDEAERATGATRQEHLEWLAGIAAGHAAHDLDDAVERRLELLERTFLALARDD